MSANHPDTGPKCFLIVSLRSVILALRHAETAPIARSNSNRWHGVPISKTSYACDSIDTVSRCQEMP